MFSRATRPSFLLETSVRRNYSREKRRAIGCIVPCIIGLLGLFLPARAQAQYSQTLPWNYAAGNSGTLFSAYLNGQVTLSGDKNGTGVSAQTAAGGSVAGHSKEIFSASAVMSADLAIPTGTVTAKLFGNSVYSKKLGSPFTGNVFADNPKYNYDSCKTQEQSLCAIQDFTIGPFLIIVEEGVKGSVALNYSVGLNKGIASASLTPVVSGSVYVAAEIEFYLADVGVSANLTLINDTLPIGVTATLAPNFFSSPPGWGVKWGFNLTNKMTLLSGSIDLFADLNFCFFDCHWQTTIFSWPGTSINNTLYNDTGWIPIGVPLPYLSSLSPSSVTVGSGDLQLTINGSGFDTVDPFSVYWDGSPVTAQSLTPAQVIVNIPSSRFVAPGQHQITVANGGTLGGTSNPLPFHVVLGSPLITQISPGAVTAGANGFTLTVYGTSLIPGSTVLWNSTVLTTTHVSDSQLTALVPAQYVSSVATAQIVVQYPISGTKSNVLMFSVFDPNVPTVTQTYPSRVFPGANDLTMHVVGTGFVQGAVVYWSGSPLVTTYVSAVQVDATVSASLMLTQLVTQVDVVNPTSTPSNSVPFTIGPITYTAVPIPPLPGRTGNAQAVAVSPNGLVGVVADDSSFAYLWSESGGITPLPIPIPAGCESSAVLWIYDINDIGQVAGSAWNAANSNCTGDLNFLFSGGDLTSLPFGFFGVATGVNDTAQIAGIQSTYSGVGNPTPPLWLPALWQGGHLQQLSTQNSPCGGEAVKVSNTGEVIGTLYSAPCTETNFSRAFSWVNGNTTVLPLLPQMVAMHAIGVNDFGLIVGDGPGTQNNYVGWKWENGTVAQLDDFCLPHFPGIYPTGRVLNNDGDVVCEQGLLSHGHVYSLSSILSSPIVGQLEAVSIADNGLMAGDIWNNGVRNPVLLKPDTPPSSLSSSPLPQSATLPLHDENKASDSISAQVNSVSQSGTFWDGQKLVTAPVTGVQPSSVVVGTTDFQVTVTGTNFLSGAVVYWNGVPIKTTFGSSSSLIASVPSALIASTGYATITAANPGGGVSNGFVIAVVNPMPILTTLSPAQAIAGSAGFTLTVSGENFQPGSQIYWNQTPLSGTYLSSNGLTAAIPAGLLASPSVEAITVLNPAPGGGASTPIVFGLNPPSPVANSLSPSSAIAGSGDLPLAISGGGFDATSVVLWNSAALQTTYVSPSLVSVRIPASDLATAGSSTIMITDTIPGGWPSGSLIFTIDNPTPQVSSASPSSVQAGAVGFTVTVSGTGFVVDSQVYLDGSPLATTYVSSGQLKASLANNDLTIARTAQLTVINPQPCNTPVSGPIPFTITDRPVIQAVNPGVARAGSAPLSIQITGSGFTNQSAVTWNDTQLQTSFVSATKLSANVPSNLIASTGTFAVRVLQQVAGGGRSAAAPFTVYTTTLPPPVIAALAPLGIKAGSKNLVLSVSGSGIVSTTLALWNGISLPTGVVSPNRMLVEVPDANISSPAMITIQLQTPTDSTGSGGGLSNSVVFNVFDSSQATTTDYTSASAFSAAVPNVTAIGFNGILAPGQLSANFAPLGVSGLTLSTPTPSASVTVETSTFYTPNNYPGDVVVSTGALGSNNTLVISLPQPTNALGLNYGGLSGSGSSTITLSNGHIFAQTTTPGVGSTAFAGFVSTDPFTSLTLSTTDDSWVVLNLLVTSVGNQIAPATPVPSDKIAVTASGLAYSRISQTFNGTVTIQNISTSPINGPFEILFTALPSRASLTNPTGTYNESPYLVVPFTTSLAPGQSVTVSVQFKNPNNVTISFTPIIYSGSF